MRRFLTIDVAPHDARDVCLLQKRRSERNANKKKKYLDDLDLNLTDEEKPPEAELEGDGPVVKPVRSVPLHHGVVWARSTFSVACRIAFSQGVLKG